jgi:hypothetical protein
MGTTGGGGFRDAHRFLSCALAAPLDSTRPLSYLVPMSTESTPPRSSGQPTGKPTPPSSDILPAAPGAPPSPVLPREDPRLAAETVQAIAAALAETGAQPRQLIWRIVRVVGPERALAFLAEAQAVEAQGGLWVQDGSRRRTPGGVFFWLVRGAVSAQERARLWPLPARPPTGPAAAGPSPGPPRKAPAAVPAAFHRFSWAERQEVLEHLGSAHGEARSVKITLIGRPGTISDQGSCIVSTMQPMKAPALPKGLPSPPATPTTYAVYIARKQWTKVADALQDPEDVLILEGFAALDPETTTIAVFATNVTTKQLQQAIRAQQQQPVAHRAPAEPPASPPATTEPR